MTLTADIDANYSYPNATMTIDELQHVRTCLPTNAFAMLPKAAELFRRHVVLALAGDADATAEGCSFIRINVG